MERIDFEGYVNYHRTFCGVKNARELASKIFSENYSIQQINPPQKKFIEIEDCNYDAIENYWTPSGRIEKIRIRFRTSSIEPIVDILFQI